MDVIGPHLRGRSIFRSVRSKPTERHGLATVLLPNLAFSQPRWQLPRYLETMEEAGLTEVFLPALQSRCHEHPTATSHTHRLAGAHVRHDC
jgi:hypothetical protein